jgi:hypothetical protein
VRHYLKKKKKSSQKRAGGVAQGVGPEFKFQYQKKRKERNPQFPRLCPGKKEQASEGGAQESTDKSWCL